MRKVPQKHGGKINQFDKGESGNPNGRPPKIFSQLTKEGYKKSQITDTILSIYSLPVNEIRDIAASRDGEYNGKKLTALEYQCARLIANDFGKFRMDAFRELLARALGQPKAETDVNIKGGEPFKIEYEPE